MQKHNKAFPDLTNNPMWESEDTYYNVKAECWRK